MSANGIAQLSTKEARQKAKLDLAAQKKWSQNNPRHVYDLSQLPTQYSDNRVVNNVNTNGLIIGRPWVVDPAGGNTFYGEELYSRGGLYWRKYSGYFNDTPNWFATATKTNESDGNPILTVSSGDVSSWQYLGYYFATSTGTHTFYLESDDASYMWLGNSAVSGFTTSNALVSNGGTHAAQERSGTVDLIEGTYYPIRIQYGNAASSGMLWARIATPIAGKTNLIDNLAYNLDTAGI